MKRIRTLQASIASFFLVWGSSSYAGFSDFAQQLSDYSTLCGLVPGLWSVGDYKVTYMSGNSLQWTVVANCYHSGSDHLSTLGGNISTSSSSPPPSNNYPRCGQSQSGSIVDVDGQTVAEKIPIAGAAFNLTYSSRWAASLSRDYKFVAPINGSTPDDSYDVELKILGQTFDTASIPNSADQIYTHQWNGKDISNNPVLGSVKAELVITPDTAGAAVSIFQSIGTLKAKLLGFGGWLPSNYHFYDIARKTLLRGDGTSNVVASIVTGGGTHLVPEVDGSVVYEFDSTGKHVYTKTGLIGTTVATFGYTTYSGVDLLTSITQPFSRVTTFSRNGSGVLTGITSPDGIVTSVTISSGLLTAVTNPNSETYAMTYKTSTDLLETFTKPGSQENTFTYDSSGQLIHDAHTGGHEFDLARTQTYPDQYTTEVETSMGRTTTSLVTSSLLGTEGQFIRSTALPSGATQSYSQSDTSISIGRGGYSRTSGWQDDARFGISLPFTTYRTEGTRTTSYAQSVTLATGTDPFSIGTLTTTSTLDGHNTVMTYYGTGSLFTVTSAAGRVRTVDIDSYERVVYDKQGTDTPVTYTYTNDKLTGIDQGVRSTVLAYNGSGMVSSVTNDLSQTTGFSYDAALRLRYINLPDSRVIQYTYDSNGNVASITPPGRSAHVFVPNGHELLDEYQPPTLTGPLVTNTSYDYNDDKQLELITRPDSQTIDFTYGSTTGNLETIVTPDGTYYYGFNTSAERIDSATTPAGVSNTLYFTSGLPSADYVSANSKSYNHQKSYNTIRQLDYDQTYPHTGSYVQVNYTYDYDELLTSAGDLTINRHAATGRVDNTAIDLVTDQWTYNSFGELTGYTLKFNSSNVFAYTITRDDLGRVDTKSETVQSVTNTFDYGYDSTGRLDDVDKNSSNYSAYVYDDNSNRLTGNIGGTSFSAVYDQQDRLTDWGVYDFTYTVNGELSTKVNTMFSQTTTYVYDVLGNLKSVTLPNSDLIEYEADGFNRRTMRKFNSSVTDYYMWDEQRLVATMDSSGAFKGRFVYGTKSHVPDYMIVGSDKYRIVTDQLGSVRMVIKTDDGTVAQKMEYNELGRVLTDTNPGFQPFGFAGGLYDVDTKLVRFGARDYDPEFGRWTNKDPIRFQGGDANLYGYVLQDPVNYVDPSGLFLSGDQVSGVVGGFIGGAYLGRRGGWMGMVAGGFLGATFGGAMGPHIGNWLDNANAALPPPPRSEPPMLPPPFIPASSPSLTCR